MNSHISRTPQACLLSVAAAMWFGIATASALEYGEVNSYDPVTASADSIQGPYGKRSTPITGGGHGNFFKDREGNWWACVFNNPRNKCNKGGWKERPAIVAMKWVDGRLKVDKERTDTFYSQF